MSSGMTLGLATIAWWAVVFPVALRSERAGGVATLRGRALRGVATAMFVLGVAAGLVSTVLMAPAIVEGLL